MRCVRRIAKALLMAQMVTLPYPLLLQKAAREALNLSLKDHVVIIDEAHNLMDAIAGIHSVAVTLDQLQQCRIQLIAYLQKFRNKLKGKNRVYVAQTVRLVDSLVAHLQTRQSDAKADGVADVADLMSGTGVDQINLYKLSRYIQQSHLARKVDGYTAHTQEDQAKSPRQSVPVLTHVQSFLLALMNPSSEGRFFYSSEGKVELQYLLLDPTFHFKDVVEDARAIVLAGGTMSPVIIHC